MTLTETLSNDCVIQDTLNILKAEGYTFPTLRESDAMFAADRAPNWSDGDNCHRCRVQFSVIVRKVVLSFS